MKKIIFSLISLILFSACSVNINLNEPNKTSDPETNNQTPIPTVQSVETPTPKPTTTPLTEISINDQLTNFFANKFNKPSEDMILTISKNTGTHASGGIKFQGEIAGGMWLAYKNASNNWIVVFDGNGTIPCESVEPHNFPTSMVPECWDETNSQIKNL